MTTRGGYTRLSRSASLRELAVPSLPAPTAEAKAPAHRRPNRSQATQATAIPQEKGSPHQRGKQSNHAPSAVLPCRIFLLPMQQDSPHQRGKQSDRAPPALLPNRLETGTAVEGAARRGKSPPSDEAALYLGGLCISHLALLCISSRCSNHHVKRRPSRFSSPVL